MSDRGHVSGQALDRCICVHAEQNAIITAARFGIEVQESTLYTTQSPCFGCLKESLQAGLRRVVYAHEYQANTAMPSVVSTTPWYASCRRTTSVLSHLEARRLQSNWANLIRTRKPTVFTPPARVP